MERIVLRGRNITLGKILRFQGHFQEALDTLKAVLQESKIDSFYDCTGWRRVLLSNIGDLYCELRRPADAQFLLEPELKQMIDSGSQNISSGRRLQLTLAESFIRSGMYEKAEEVLSNLGKLWAAAKKSERGVEMPQVEAFDDAIAKERARGRSFVLVVEGITVR
jgi:lipopolysaccharide biosynthesis regulator YciM